MALDSLFRLSQSYSVGHGQEESLFPVSGMTSLGFFHCTDLKLLESIIVSHSGSIVSPPKQTTHTHTSIL
jgi:hypothetical protein